MSTFFSRYRRSGRTPRGFTLIELLVVVAIIVIITGVLLLRQSKFDSSTLLRSLAYSIALSVREAQVYGTSIFGVTQSGSNVFASAYGLSFSTVSPNNYVLFADLNNNGRYDTSPVDETVKVFSLSNGYTISEICGEGNGFKACSGKDDTSGSPISSLTILFRRPNPDACFTTNTYPNNCTPEQSSNLSSAYIQVATPDGSTRSIYISTTGEIAVEAPGTLP